MTARPVPGVLAPAPATWHNPLRDKRDKRMPRIAGPCGVVIFGVTGDLARKKLMPAIYDLANRGLLPPSFSLVGFARRDWADEDFGAIGLFYADFTQVADATVTALLAQHPVKAAATSA